MINQGGENPPLHRWAHYFFNRTWLPTLSGYILVLVSQDRPIIEHYRRQSDGEWILSTMDGLDASLKIESILCSLKLNDVYDGVQFPTPQNAFIEDNLPV